MTKKRFPIPHRWTKKRFPIPHRWNVTPCFVAQVDDNDPNPLRTAVVQAVAARADLAGAYLNHADLTGANLPGANLAGADLTGANLPGADLTRANLTCADLTVADLTGANLPRANLTRANLTRANLTRANLTVANLTVANLTGANLTVADLTVAREDFRLVLDAAPHEVAGLLLAVQEGRIDGSNYEGACSCLKGTIATLKHVNYSSLTDDEESPLYPDSSRPSERLFMGISPGHVPAINPVAKIVEGWILEWQAEHVDASS